jgi:hypothetical protein
MVLLLGLVASGFAAALNSRHPNTLDDVVISESFDNTPNGLLPTGWTQVSLDSGRNNDLFYHNAPTIWQAISRTGISTHTGAGTSINAYNSDHSPNNDWMILPPQSILIAPIVLSFWVSSQDPVITESFDVRVSTTDARPASFTHMVDSVAATPHMWHLYSYDLSAFAGAPFYVTIHYTSVNRYAIKVDDVTLTATIPYGAVRGIVRNASTQQPLQNVSVTVVNTNLSATTDALGTYLISPVQAGTHSLRFARAQFDTLLQSNVNVVQNDTLELDVSLNPSAAISDHGFLPGAFIFAGNYPNPFNSRTEFRFSLPNTSPVQLKLYNLTGQEVVHIVDATMNAGIHDIPFDASGLSSGVYVARLNACGMSAMHKVVLLK